MTEVGIKMNFLISKFPLCHVSVQPLYFLKRYFS